MGKIVRFTLAGLASAMLLASAPAAMAVRHAPAKDGVTATGPCSGASTWKLTASPENGGVEVQFEVDSNVVGQTWKVRLSDNGTVFFKGSAVTQGPSGSFEVRKFATDQAGSDLILGLAKNTATGETCEGSVTL
jgi:hypothetical protein